MDTSLPDIVSTEAGPGRDARVKTSPSRVRSAWIGALAAAGMAALYTAVVVGASGSVGHYVDQVGTDWYLLLPIVLGFGVQVGLLAELRRRHGTRRIAATAGVAGTGASTVGMVACCAHHIADLLPLLGATAAATFLYEYRLPFMLTGIGLNAAGVAVSARRLHRVAVGAGGGRERGREGASCVAQ